VSLDQERAIAVMAAPRALRLGISPKRHSGERYARTSTILDPKLAGCG
jgi:hypothetical protein